MTVLFSQARAIWERERPFLASTKVNVHACPHRWWKADSVTAISAGKVPLPPLSKTAYTAKSQMKTSEGLCHYLQGRSCYVWVLMLDSQELETLHNLVLGLSHSSRKWNWMSGRKHGANRQPKSFLGGCTSGYSIGLSLGYAGTK